MTAFDHLAPETLERVSEFLEYGGQPLADWERDILNRALKIADDDPEDAAAVLLVAADENREAAEQRRARQAYATWKGQHNARLHRGGC